MKKIVLLVAALSFVACKDERGGETIEKTADKTAPSSATASASGSVVASASPSTSSSGLSGLAGIGHAEWQGGCADGAHLIAGGLNLIGTKGSATTGLGASGEGTGSGETSSYLAGDVDTIGGALKNTDVGGPICDATAGFKSCFEGEESATKKLDREVVVSVTLDATGKVTSTKSKETNAAKSTLACIAAAMSALSFPGGGATFDYRFTYARNPVPASAKVKDPDLEVKGALSPEAVRRVLRSNFGRFRACYIMALKTSPGVKGTVVEKLVIGAGGEVDSVTPQTGTMTYAPMSNCVASAMRAFTFPAPDDEKPVTATYTLDFEPPEK